MSQSYLYSTPSKLLASHTSNVGQLSWLAAWLRLGKGLIQRMGKWKNKGGEGKLPAAIVHVKLSVVSKENFRGAQKGQSKESSFVLLRSHAEERYPQVIVPTGIITDEMTIS